MPVRERTRIEGSGRGSAWLERLVRDQEVAGSNPVAPIQKVLFPKGFQRHRLETLFCCVEVETFLETFSDFGRFPGHSGFE